MHPGFLFFCFTNDNDDLRVHHLHCPHHHQYLSEDIGYHIIGTRFHSERGTCFFNEISIREFPNTFHAAMRVPFVEYLTFALFTSAIDLDGSHSTSSVSGPPSVEVQLEVAPINLGVTDPTVSSIQCLPSFVLQQQYEH